MSEEYKVSLIVAVYNSAPFLDKLITSIVNQTYRNIEIILVDDGSPDNSGKMTEFRLFIKKMVGRAKLEIMV